MPFKYRIWLWLYEFSNQWQIVFYSNCSSFLVFLFYPLLLLLSITLNTILVCIFDKNFEYFWGLREYKVRSSNIIFFELRKRKASYLFMSNSFYRCISLYMAAMFCILCFIFSQTCKGSRHSHLSPKLWSIS